MSYLKLTILRESYRIVLTNNTQLKNLLHWHMFNPKHNLKILVLIQVMFNPIKILVLIQV